MKRLSVCFLVLIAAASLAMAGCTQAAPTPAPTAAPAAAPTKPAAAAPTAVPTKAPTAPPTTAAATKVDFPTKGKSISILVGFTAGSGTDISTRLLAGELEKELGTPIVVLNKPGATTQVAMTEVATAKPDGYTLGLTVFMSILVTYLDQDRNAAYSRKDFEPVAHFVRDGNVLVVSPNGPFKTVKDLVDAAKASPGTIRMAATGVLSNTHLMELMLEKEAGVKFATVQFPGAPEVLAALMGGHIDGMVLGASVTLPHFKSGAVRVIGIADKEESPFFPGVKTIESQGYRVLCPFSSGLAAPAGTPKDVIEVLSRAVKKVVENEGTKKKMLDIGNIPSYMDSQQFAAYWADLEVQVKPMIAAAKQGS